MEIRLAYERGFLTKESLNWVQRWALLYWVYLERRIKSEDIDSFLERQTLNLNYEQWARLYRDRIMGQLGVEDKDELPVTEDDLDALDAFMSQQEAEFNQILHGTHSTGPASRNVSGQAEPLQWGAWT